MSAAVNITRLDIVFSGRRKLSSYAAASGIDSLFATGRLYLEQRRSFGRAGFRQRSTGMTATALPIPRFVVSPRCGIMCS